MKRSRTTGTRGLGGGGVRSDNPIRGTPCLNPSQGFVVRLSPTLPRGACGTAAPWGVGDCQHGFHAGGSGVEMIHDQRESRGGGGKRRLGFPWVFPEPRKKKISIFGKHGIPTSASSQPGPTVYSADPRA